MADGYTGPGAVIRVAGIVHAGEFVANARATANPRNRTILESMNRDGYVRPTYIRSSSSGLDAKTLVEAPKSAPVGNRNTQQNIIQPIQGLDPQTAITIIGRELNRQMAGIVS